jgi:hypothetical protein
MLLLSTVIFLILKSTPIVTALSTLKVSSVNLYNRLKTYRHYINLDNICDIL